MVTVSSYIKSYPKSQLAKNLARQFGVQSRKEIHVGSGLIAPANPRSNIGSMMRRYDCKDYIVGGRAGKNRNDGYHFAVFK